MKTITNVKGSLDLNFIEDAKKLDKRTKHLIKMTNPILENIFNAYYLLPVEIIRACKFMFETCNERFTGSGYYALSSFIFLRFICPALSSPDYQHVFLKNPLALPPQTRKNFIQVTKLIHRIATFNQDFTDDVHNTRFREFVCSNIFKMKAFYDSIAQVCLFFHFLTE